MRQGQLVEERFEVSGCVGSGSCGAVYRAWDRVLERQVAIKELNRAADERVMRTSRAAARLNHPAIVPLYEIGEADGAAFLVSEYIDGLTLRQAHSRGLLTDRDVAEVGADLCEGLHHAHGRGVVHGDIKPENVIVRSREENPDQRSGRCQAKLRDFATREIAGSEPDCESAYLTPEQLDGHEPEPASDVFGVALVLYECWTGRNPLAGVSPRAARIRGRHLPSLADERPDLPPRLAEVIDRSLDPEPDRRPGALELHEWLDHVFDDLDFELAVPAPAPSAPARPPHRAVALLTVLAAASGFGSAYLATEVIDRVAAGESLWALAPLALGIGVAIWWAVLLTRLMSATTTRTVTRRPVRSTVPPPERAPIATAPSLRPPDPAPGELVIERRDPARDPVRAASVP